MTNATYLLFNDCFIFIIQCVFLQHESINMTLHFLLLYSQLALTVCKCAQVFFIVLQQFIGLQHFLLSLLLNGSTFSLVLQTRWIKFFHLDHIARYRYIKFCSKFAKCQVTLYGMKWTSHFRGWKLDREQQ